MLQAKSFVPTANHRSVAGAIYMYFMLREGWHCQFLEADLKTPLPKKLNLSSSQKVTETAVRGGYNMNLEPIHIWGGIWLLLTEEQYQKLRTCEDQSERATSLAGRRPLYPISRRSGTAPGSQRIIAALFRNCEQSPHFPHGSVIGIARASSLPSFQLPGMSTVAGPLKCPWSALFFGRLLFRWF